jgi:hypothetical protein
MKLVLCTVFPLCVLTLLFSCRGADKVPTLPSPSEYTRWARPIPGILHHPIPGHENNRRRIFINAPGTQVKVERRENRVYWEYPEGTIIVKEIIAGLQGKDSDSPFQLTVMIKAPEDPRSRGGWLWVAKAVDSGEQTVVDWEFCVDCHANANEPHPYGDRNKDSEFRDYVYYPYRKQ